MRSGPLVGVVLPLMLLGTAVAGPADWPQFRGHEARGVAPGDGPVEWDVASGKNVKWRVPTPGLGLSSPVVWGEKIFLTTAVSEGEQKLKVGLYGDIASVQENSPVEFRVVCLDKNTGKVLWEKTAHKGVPRVKRHPKASHANSTPAVDGQRVVAFFGSEGLYCYALDGKELWKKDFGVLDSGFFRVPAAQWGFASSPVLHEGKVIVQCDVQKGSFVTVLDAASGEPIWRTERAEVPTWSTPAVAKTSSGTQVVCNGWKEIAGYELESGKRAWTIKGGGDIPVPTPVAGHGLVFITNAHGQMSPVYAVNVEKAKGDVTPEEGKENPAVAWWIRRGGNYMQTPIVLEDYLYGCQDNGVVSCWEAKTGKQVFRQRIGGGKGFTASPIAIGKKLYFTAEDGMVYVLEAGAEFKLLKENSLGEESMATPAVSGGVVYFRTKGHLAAVSDQ